MIDRPERYATVRLVSNNVAERVMCKFDMMAFRR